MVVSVPVESLCDAVETVQVELSLEGRKLGLAEVFGHDDLFEQFRLMDDEASPVWLPGYDGIVSIVFDFLECLMESFGERYLDSPSACSDCFFWHLEVYPVGVVVLDEV